MPQSQNGFGFNFKSVGGDGENRLIRYFQSKLGRTFFVSYIL
jgi:hypothetical protein